MYYIINENQQIIASDDHFLEHCNVSDITTLNKAILLETILLDINTEKIGKKVLTLKHKDNTSLFTIETIALSSLLGALSLMVLSPMKTEEIAITDKENLIINKQSNNIIPHLTTHTDSDIDKELSTQTIQKPIIRNRNSDHKSIVIDSVEISQKIGVSEKDYHDFFNDYISTALSLEKDLRNHADMTQSKAIETLLHLGEVLHLDLMQENVIRIQNATAEHTPSEVASFYEMLSRITLEQPTDTTIVNEIDAKEEHHENIDLALTPPKSTEEKPMITKEVPKDDTVQLDLDILPISDNVPSDETNTSHDDTVPSDLDLPLDKSDKASSSQEEVVTSQKPIHQTLNNTSATTLYLSEVQPIHFDFSLSTAAKELSLPENLIKEFMLDFISQAHTETATMLKAYQDTDLETIQKTGHLLKGVASNLRITTLSDALHNIQFSSDLAESKARIRNFWGYFLSFEAQMNSLSQ